MKNRIVFCLLLASAWISALAIAADPPTITVRKGDEVNVAFKGVSGSDGNRVASVLENDLRIAGSFQVVSGDRATYVIAGEIQGGRLNGRVVDQRGGVVLAKSYSGGVRSLAHQFADDIVETITGRPGIANTKIAFVSTRTGKKEIYLADYDGAGVEQLTRDNAISVAPALAPDGKKLAYTGYQSGYADIYLIDLANGARRRIIKFPGTNSGAAISPDSASIACTMSKDGNPELYVVGINGGGPRRLTQTRGVESGPTWSPDGREIIYSSDARGTPQLYRVHSSGGEATLIPTGYNYNTEPSWSPDGRKLAFVVRSGGFAVVVKDLTNGQSRVIAQGAKDPVWAKNSRHLLYTTSDERSLILCDTQTGKSTPVVTNLGKVSEPAW